MMANWRETGLPWLGLAVLVILVDQLTKQWATSMLVPYEPVFIAPILNLTLAFNPGAAFSFLGNENGWQRWLFIGLAFAVSGILSVWLAKNKVSQRGLNVGLSLILGGAIGNVIDRLTLHHVIDFLDFHWGVWHYPTFNVADIAITFGALLLLWDAWRQSKHPTIESN
jgi:signal peptidase II